MMVFEKTIYSISRYLNWVSCVAIAGIVVIVCVNIVARFFEKPLLGAFEIVRLLAALATVFSVAHTQVMNGHSSVGIIENVLGKRKRTILNISRELVLIALSFIITWQSVLYAIDMWKKGEVTATMYYPLYPFLFGISFCFALLSLVFVCRFLDLMSNQEKKIC